MIYISVESIVTNVIVTGKFNRTKESDTFIRDFGTVFILTLLKKEGTKMKVSINTAVFVKHLNNGESQIACLQNLNKIANLIDSIQVRDEFFDLATKDKELEEIKSLCEKNNWNLYYSVPEDFFKDKKINPSFKENLTILKKHGIKYLKYFIGDATKIVPKDIQEVENMLEESNINLTLENLSNKTGSLYYVKTALEAIKNMKKIGFTFDAGNWYWVDENPNKAFSELKSQITNFHLKDIKNKDTTMLGNGNTDWTSMVENLDNTIPIFLEYEIPDNQITDQIKLVNSVINKR